MIEIVPYNSLWPLEFREIGRLLRQALGALALRIDHIGSTSVPGLAAKDVIDIQITVKRLDVGLLAPLEALGYVGPSGIRRDHIPPGLTDSPADWAKYLYSAPPGQRRTHVHIREQGHANQRYALLFRDYLRAHPATAAAYADLKLRLAQNLANPETYPDVKDPAVDLIYLPAEVWATTTEWQAGPSDA